jgi:regulatory protein spx
MSDKSIQLIWKKTCDTCRKYKKQLDAWAVDYEGREINSEPLTTEDVTDLIGEREVKPFLNTRNAVYRELGLAKDTPSKARAISLIAETNNLLRRPILVVDGVYVIGNRLDDAAELLGKTR